ncbi:MAG: bifunctional indole-3-glycerol phosphate synthase/tryptophan synthase subunit beta, partial [Bifidobacteriaceae bacterium]|nr:bifunctional indole-3-glycerol phosphate synthase/tryptophan synthase subunit beta [Bifidobacteriaceae bacterium]
MNVLDEIVCGVLADLKDRQACTPLDRLKEVARNRDAAKDPMPALRDADSLAVIAEVKRSSPSKGPIAAIPDPAVLATAYEEGGAAI